MKHLILALVALTLVGCVSQPLTPAEQIHTIRATHVELKQTAVDLINAGVIKDQFTKDVIWSVSIEIYDGLNEAEAALGQGKEQQALFVIRRIRSALTRFAILMASKKKGTQWDPSRSPSSLLFSRPGSGSFTTSERLVFRLLPRTMSS